MNREEARKLVQECSADAEELDRDDYNVGIEALFHALVAARLAPEPERSATHGRPVGLGACEHGCEKLTHGRFCSPECAECESGGQPCSSECAMTRPDDEVWEGLVTETGRPSYVPDGAPWEWTTLANGERVAMWVADDEAKVRLFDPRIPGCPWSLEGLVHILGLSQETIIVIGPTALAAVEAFGRKHGVWK